MDKIFPRKVMRTVRNGQVKIYGRYYSPPLNDGRFEGNKYQFALYHIGSELEKKVSLVCSVAMLEIWKHESKTNPSFHTYDWQPSPEFDIEYTASIHHICGDDPNIDLSWWYVKE